MQYIDESGPWTADHFRKYATYLKLRKERDKFLKSLREVRYCDWLIDKKLVEAGGLGKTVYILPARGGGSSLSYRTLKKYYEEGRDVEFVTLKKSEPNRDNIAKIKELVIDWDLYCDRERQALYEEIDKYIHEKIMQRFREDIVKDWIRDKHWITTAWPDSYIFSPKTYTDWTMRDFLLNPHYGIVYKRDDPVYMKGE